MKKLNWYDIRETERIKVAKGDMEEINYCIDNEIEMEYDSETLKVFNEAGVYIADIISIEEE